MKILVLNDGPGLGDFIHKGLFFMFDLHLKYKKLDIYYYQKYNNDRYRDFINTFSDIFTYIENISLFYDKVYFLTPKSNFKLEINGIEIKKHNYNLDFREKIFAYFLAVFPMKNIFNLNIKHHITISIGSVSQRKKGLTDNTFQKIIIKLIETNPELHFCIIGRPSEITDQNILLPRANVLNLIGKDQCIKDIISILFHSKTIICRNSGLLHLAGLCNKPIIYLRFLPLQFRYFFTKDIRCQWTTEREHLFYHEPWSPISNKITRIIEYKKFNPFYNRHILKHIQKSIMNEEKESVHILYYYFILFAIFIHFLIIALLVKKYN
jgi:hypothetical protein